MLSNIQNSGLKKAVLLLFPAFLIVSGNFIANSNVDSHRTGFEQTNAKRTVAPPPAYIFAVTESDDDDNALDSELSFLELPGIVAATPTLQTFLSNPDKIPSRHPVPTSLSARAPPAL